MRFLDVTLDTYQDTSRYMYLGLFITIHQDTPRYNKSRYMYLGRVMTTLQDTIRIHKDTCKINQGYMRDKCICSGSRIHEGHMRDTCTSKIHILGYVYLKGILRGTYLRCRIHAGYMRDTCICKGNQETCGIHPRYMMRYMYLKFVPTRIQTRPQVELEIRILEGIPMYPTCIVSVSFV